jgi:putative hydrolase of the HAD superfamily
MRKPDAEIFEFVLKENGLVASETLFIDDSKQHVVGALRCGLAGKLLDLKNGEELVRWWESTERKELFT